MKKVLVPIDGPEQSDRPLEFAIELARNFGAKIALCHVIQKINVPKGFRTFSDEERITNSTRAYVCWATKQVSKKSEEKVEASGVSFTPVISEGPAVDGIVRQARNQDVGLIVIGTGVSAQLHNFSRRAIRLFPSTLKADAM